MKVIKTLFFVLVSILSNFSVESYKLKTCEYKKKSCLYQLIELIYN